MFKLLILSLLVTATLTAEVPHAHRVVHHQATNTVYSHQKSSVPQYDIPAATTYAADQKPSQTSFHPSIADVGLNAYQQQAQGYQQPQGQYQQQVQYQSPQSIQFQLPQDLQYQIEQALQLQDPHSQQYQTPQTQQYQIPQGQQYQIPQGQQYQAPQTVQYQTGGYESTAHNYYQPTVPEQPAVAYETVPTYEKESNQVVNHEHIQVNHEAGPAVYESNGEEIHQHQQQHHEQEGHSNPIDVHAEAKETDSIMKPGGAYAYGFESTNGIAKKEQGVAGHAVQGISQHYTPEGELVTLEYTADENGFHAKGSHIPTPPPLPEHVIKTLEWNAAHPEEEDEDKQRQWDNDMGEDYHYHDDHYHNNDDHQLQSYHGKRHSIKDHQQKHHKH